VLAQDEASAGGQRIWSTCARAQPHTAGRELLLQPVWRSVLPRGERETATVAGGRSRKSQVLSCLLFQHHHVVDHVDYAVGAKHIGHIEHPDIIVFALNHQMHSAVIFQSQLVALK
jgi:hypothetical protein